MKKIAVILSFLMIHFLQSQTKELWGMTRDGGNYDGVIFSFNPTTNVYSKKFNFNSSDTGRFPYGSLIQTNSGLLYGLCSSGGTGSFPFGVLFEYNPVTNIYTKKIQFDGTDKGTEPLGSLIQSTNGKLYGLTVSGGKNNFGVLFEYDPTNNSYVKKHEFNGDDGKLPYGSLLEASNGKFYGMTNRGGAYDYGVFFEYDKTTNVYSKIDLSSISGNSPQGSLIQASNGKIYGMTSIGGDNGSQGIIFEYDIVTKNLIKKFSFSYANGGSPYSTLMQASNGKLYGMTKAGGANEGGVLFEYDPVSNTYIKKFDFGGSNGSNPYGILMQAENGKLYGLASSGGTSSNGSNGVLFEYSIDTNTYVKKLDFDYFNGKNPYYTKLIEVNYDLLSTKGLDKINLTIYPNPVVNKIYVNSSTSVKEFEIYSFDGKKVSSNKKDKISEIDVSKLFPGNYIIKLKMNNYEKDFKFQKK